MPPSIVARGLLPVDVTDAPTLSVEGPRSVPSRILVVLVDGTMTGDTPGRECPREDRDLRPHAGVTKPAGVSVEDGTVLGPLEHSVLDHAGPAGQHVAVGPVGPLRTLSPSDCHPAGPAGPYVAGGPVGPDGTLEVLEPLEHSVLDHADPAGQHAVIQEVLEPLEHSVLDTALDGQPMEGIPVLEPLQHSVLEMTLDGGPFEEMVD